MFTTTESTLASIVQKARERDYLTAVDRSSLWTSPGAYPLSSGRIETEVRSFSAMRSTPDLLIEFSCLS